MRRKVFLALLAVLAAGIVVVVLSPGLLVGLAQSAERSAARVSVKSTEIAGHRIVYLEGGVGEPLVLLHGFGGDKDNWTRLARYLTSRFRVIAPDLPGFGESTRDADAAYAVNEQVERVRAFTRAIGVESFHLGGNSMGGNIAAAYAAKHPGDVKTLWLVAPGGVETASPSELFGLLESGENPLLVETTEDFGRMLAFAMTEPPSLPGPIQRHLAEQAVLHRGFNEKIFRDLFDEPVFLEPIAPSIQAPTLVTWGDQDRLLHVSGAKILGETIPRAEVHVLENVGHVPMVERPEASAARFVQFVESR